MIDNSTKVILDGDETKPRRLDVCKSGVFRAGLNRNME